MIPEKSFAPKRLLLFASIFVFSFIKISAQDGKAIFLAKCASCHIMGNDGGTGPNLQGVVARWEGDTNAIKVWILDWSKEKHKRAAEAVNLKPTEMQKFVGQIDDAQMSAVIKYVDTWMP